MPTIPVRTEFPRKIREIENTWIEMPDGVKLAARIWLPEDAEADPVPAVLEYLPYRKRDGTVERDHITHPYYAGYGYAGVRVDMRGTGDSEGVCKGEYLKQEQDDAIAVIEWIAKQPWSSGAVGMIGISWGGFNGLQVAARQPTALKAVITICSTDDRYADDIHYMGGTVLGDKLAWAGTAFAIAHTPPDPAIVGPRWRDMWLERLDGNGLWLLDWFRHQRRDDFFRHGSICEDYAAVKIPVYAVGGWIDGYTNPIFRMMQNLSCPRKALVGPWAHKYPHMAVPGPRIGFIQECLRWWDQHLKGIDTGIMDEPMIRAWVQDPVLPDAHIAERPGRWVAEPAWPIAGQQPMVMHLAPGRLADRPADEDIIVSSRESAGGTMQVWCAYGASPDQAIDQAGEDGSVSVFLSEPLEEDMEILGFPMLTAEVSSDKPVANLFAVLSGENPDGSATLVSFGGLNLTHRNSHSDPEPLVPGKPEKISLQLNVIGQRFTKGQRIRLAVSNALWPMVWPSPERTRLTIRAGTARLSLPVRSRRPEDGKLADFGPAEGTTPLQATALSPGSYSRTISQDFASGKVTALTASDTGRVRHDHTGITIQYLNEDRFDVLPYDPNSATGTSFWRKCYARNDWQADVETLIRVEALRNVWRINASLIAREGGTEIFRRDWHEDVPRDLV